MPRPHFICDAMLGRLATWLRLLGYDCAYRRGLAHQHLLDCAEREGRILLTRDTRLLKRRRIRQLTHLWVMHDDFRDQLVQVIESFGLDRHRAGRKCPRCNLDLEEVSREAVTPVIPAFVAATQRSFRRCPACRRVFWSATHQRAIEAELDRIFMRVAGKGTGGTNS